MNTRSILSAWGCAVLLTATLGGASTATAEESAAPAAASSEAAADPQAKTCKQVKDTGTIGKRRVCKTQAEWDRVARDTARNTQQPRRTRNQASQ